MLLLAASSVAFHPSVPRVELSCDGAELFPRSGLCGGTAAGCSGDSVGRPSGSALEGEGGKRGGGYSI